MKLIKRNGKYLIERGFFFKEYLDMTHQHFSWWWADEQWIKVYCLAESEEHALYQLAQYRQLEIVKRTKVLKWFV